MTTWHARHEACRGTRVMREGTACHEALRRASKRQPRVALDLCFDLGAKGLNAGSGGGLAPRGHSQQEDKVLELQREASQAAHVQAQAIDLPAQ